MSTVIEGIKFSKYNYSVEECNDITPAITPGVHYSIVPEGTEGEDNINLLIADIAVLLSNPWWSHLKVTIHNLESRYGGNLSIIICDELTWNFLMGYVLAKYSE